MSHIHGCDVAGHTWQCDSGDCICICQKPMGQDDHEHCPIELRVCPEHDGEQVSIADSEQGVGSRATRTEPEGWGRLEPIAPKIEEKLSDWFASDRESIGFCCLCGHSIRTEADFIKGRNTHDCKEGRAFEEKIRRRAYLPSNQQRGQ